MLADGTLQVINGSAAQERPDEPAYLTLRFPGRPDGSYLVLDTDYNTWTAIYSCDAVGIFKFEFAWLMARTPSISQEVEDQGMKVFTGFGIDITRFAPTPQDDTCIYSL